MKYHIPHVEEFVEKYGSEYVSLKQIKPGDGISEWSARDLSLYVNILVKIRNKYCTILFIILKYFIIIIL